jgi:hypothetical protein
MSRLDDAGSPIAFPTDPLTAERVAELDLAETRPQGLGPTIKPATTPGAPTSSPCQPCTGRTGLLRAVLTDEQQLPAAEELAHALVRFMSAPTDSSRRGVRAAWPIDSRIHRWTAEWCWVVEGDAFLDLLVERIGSLG